MLQDEEIDLTAALRDWLAAGQPNTWLRAKVTGAGASRLLVATGLATPDDIAQCVVAQARAPAPTLPGLRDAIESDLFALASLGPPATVAGVSEVLVGSWADACQAADSVHFAHANCLALAGRIDECEPVLSRIRWHAPLLRFLELHGSLLTDQIVAAVSEAIVVRLHRWLPIDYHVGVFAQLSVLTRNIAWLERAESVVAELPAAELESNPDREHPVVSIARAEAELGRIEPALERVRELADDERWVGLVALAELSPGLFDSLRDELVALHLRQDLPWWTAVDSLPGLAPIALAAIEGLPTHERSRELLAIAPFVPADCRRDVCRRALVDFESPRSHDPAGLTETWSLLLDRLIRCEAIDLLDSERRERLVDEWRALGQPEDLADLICPFVPDREVDDVLASAEARLRDSSTWTERGAWLGCGANVCSRASADPRTSWLLAAAAALPSLPIDQIDEDALAPFTTEVRREIALRSFALAQGRLLDRAHGIGSST